MKLIIAILSDKLHGEIIQVLTKSGIQFTKLSSTGGFLKKGNTTLLLGVEDGELSLTIDKIKTVVEASKNKSTNKDLADANIFVLPMESFTKM